MLNMEEFCQFLCCWVAVDGYHIPIRCFYSWVLIAFVDAKYRFIWASCGFPANSHDSVMLQSTTLWQQIKEVDFIPKLEKKIEGRTQNAVK